MQSWGVDDGGILGDDFPAKGGLQPPPGVIEDVISDYGIVLDDAEIDWKDVYDSISDPLCRRRCIAGKR